MLASAPDLQPASALDPVALTDLFNQIHEGSAYPSDATPELLLGELQAEGVDLERSPVIAIAGEPAGLALLGLREEAWLGALGVRSAYRGHGLSRRLLDALVESARRAGPDLLRLEVLKDNREGINLYTGAGCQVQRRLLALHSQRPRLPVGPRRLLPVFPLEPAVAVARAGHGRLQKACWQRRPATLLGYIGLYRTVAYVAVRRHAPAGYMLVRPVEGGILIMDLAVAPAAARRRRDVVTALVAELIRAYPGRSLSLMGEPAEEGVADALAGLGFTQVDTQYEMILPLA